MPDKGWTKLHSDEVQEMLYFKVEGEQYEIQCHHFTNGKLQFIVNNGKSETLTSTYVVDYPCTHHLY